MAENYLQKLGFKDEDLTSPLHDYLVLQLTEEKIISLFVKHFPKIEKEIREREIPTPYTNTIATVEISKEQIEKIKTVLPNYRCENSCELWRWFAYTNRNTFQILPLDNTHYNNAPCDKCKEKWQLLAPIILPDGLVKTYKEKIEKEINDTELSVQQERKEYEWKQTLKIKYEVKLDRCGFVDCVATLNKYRLIIEVKPKIKSFGETLRQINTYKDWFLQRQEYYEDDCDRRRVVLNKFILYLGQDTEFRKNFEKEDICVEIGELPQQQKQDSQTKLEFGGGSQ